MTNVDITGPIYTLGIAAQGFAPADATTYYFGGRFPAAPSTGPANQRIYIPAPARITRIDMTAVVGVAGDDEQSTLNLRLNNSTNTAIITNLDLSANFVISNSALSIAVVAGDFVEIQWPTPTWSTTNPTSVFFFGNIFLEP